MRTATATLIRGKAFCEMKKDVGMTTAQKSKETRRMEMFCISSRQSLHIRRVASDYSTVMYCWRFNQRRRINARKTFFSFD